MQRREPVGVYRCLLKMAEWGHALEATCSASRRRDWGAGVLQEQGAQRQVPRPLAGSQGHGKASTHTCAQGGRTQQLGQLPKDPDPAGGQSTAFYRGGSPRSPGGGAGGGFPLRSQEVGGSPEVIRQAGGSLRSWRGAP